MSILSVGRAFPPHYYDQETLIAAFLQHWAGAMHNQRRLEQLHRHVLVGGRYLALPLEEYPKLQGFTDANNHWIRVALDVGAAAITDALDRARIQPDQVGALFFTTVTGLCTPSLDARLMNRLKLPPQLKRLPLFGLGCVAGAAGIARAADYVRAFPDQAALLLSVELCSLTIQRQDISIPNLISSGLFGDGAACAVVAGARLTERLQEAGSEAATYAPTVLATRSVFYPDSEEVMGWDISERGFRIVLSAGVPEVVKKHLRQDVDQFLAAQGLHIRDINSWVCHPGGPKVLEAFEEVLELDPEALALTWRSLREVGNLSSSSVLMVLRDTMESRRPPAGSLGLLIAMGPGFCSELVLLQW
jgi:alkylresorcinol/alkylpyrone synthase